MQTQKGEIALDRMLKKALAGSRTLFSEEGQEELHGKRGLISAPLVKTLQKASGTWERDYTHDFYSGPKFSPHTEGWSLNAGEYCTKQPGEPFAKSASTCPDCYILLSC